MLDLSDKSLAPAVQAALASMEERPRKGDIQLIHRLINLPRARHDGQLMQEELAERAGLSARYVGAIKRATVSASVLSSAISPRPSTWALEIC